MMVSATMSHRLAMVAIHWAATGLIIANVALGVDRTTTLRVTAHISITLVILTTTMRLCLLRGKSKYHRYKRE